VTADPAPTETIAPAKPKRSGMIRSSMIYSGLTLVSRFMGFFRDLAISYRLGASATFAADAYNAAFAFPNLFRRIFAEGAFASAFIPAYAKSLEQDGEEVADILAADAMATLAAATIALTLAAELAMPWLMYLMNPGYAANPDKFKLTIVLTQITMPYLPCMAIYAHLSGVLQARGRFILSAAAPIFLNLVTLAAIIPQTSARAAAVAGSWGVIVAGVLQAGLLWWGVRRSGARVDFRLPRLTPEIKALIARAVPGAIAASAMQINIFISGVLVSGVNGARSWLAYADRLYMLPLSLVGVAVGVALLPRLSRAVHAGDGAESQRAMDEAVSFSMALTLPAAAALVAIPFFLNDGLWTRGVFKIADAHATASALRQYGWGVPAFVLARLFTPAFYARHDTRTPMIFALVSIGVNIAAGVGLYSLVGFWGIAAATSLASWLNVFMLAGTLAWRGSYAPGPKAWSRIGRSLAASIALGCGLALASRYRASVEHLFHGFHLVIHAIGPKELALLLTVVVGALAYPPLLLALGGVSRAEVRAALRRPPKIAGEDIPPPELL
jgi:putative peptidoglycan lipid II flippase